MGAVGAQLVTALIQGIILLATIDTKVTILYDFDINGLFSGCADMNLIETRMKEKSTGFKRLSTDTIQLRMFKLYYDDNILFATNKNEIFGYKQFDEKEIKAMEEYQHIVALDDKAWFNKEAYKKLQNKVADFCWNKVEEDPDMKVMVYENKSHFENGLRGLMSRNFTNSDGNFNGWVNFNGKLNGYGICEFKDGTTYSGDWKDNKFSGNGKITYNDEVFYSGEFSNGKRNGYGVYQNRGNYYEGKWSEDKWNGQGALVENDILYEGVWQKGDLKTGIIVYDNGDSYEGSIKKVKKPKTDLTERIPDGKGIMTFVNGEILDGKWKNGKFIPEKQKENKQIKKQ
jgi:hypothetical protein